MWKTTTTTERETSLKFTKLIPPTPYIPDFQKDETVLPDEVLKLKEDIDSAYNVITHWRKNLFNLPTSKIGKTFIQELSKWLDHFNQGTKYRCIALKIFIILPALLLQKPSLKSKSAEHNELLKKRFELWEQRDITKLLKEGKIIQRRLTQSKMKEDADTARKFSNLMFEGKVTSAIRMLCDNDNKGLLSLSDETLDQLIQKHPEPADIKPESLLHGPVIEVDESYFNCVNEAMIFRASKFTNGSSGPSQTDAAFFKYILTSNRFKKEGKELREKIATFTRLIGSQHINPEHLDAYVNCRLIPINKCPGVRPIGIGETFRRIVGKSLSWVMKNDIQQAGGPLQVSTGLKSGAEAAIHFVREQFDLEASEAVVMVDASNAFNSLNRLVMLHNIQIICPEISTVTINMYRRPSKLFVSGTELLSQEGTTQGDNLAMSIFSLGTIPILRKLQNITDTSQVWLADDASGVGTLDSLYEWWSTIINEGRRYGYYVNQKKSCLILKNPDDLKRATEIFNDLEITISVDGQRHLGAVIGSPEYREKYIKNLVQEWCDMLENLTVYARSQPHAAYSAFTIGVRQKFTYFLRTIKGIGDYLEPVDKIISDKFIPTLFGCHISPIERQIVSLPVRNGGLGIPFITEIAAKEYNTSLMVTEALVSTMREQNGDVIANEQKRKDALQNILSDRINEYKENQESISKQCSQRMVRLLQQASEKYSSNWLTCLPLKVEGFVLNKLEFRDSLRLRYGKDLSETPSNCPCGATYDITHALNCHKGGFIIIRHNEIRDFVAKTINTVCNDTEVEPNLQPLESEVVQSLDGDKAKPDIRARGFWRAGQHAYFDVKVINPNSESYISTPTEKIYDRAEKDKKRKYNDRIMNVEGGTFTPLIFSVYGGVGPEAHRFIKLLCNKISYKHKQNYNDTIKYFRCKLAFLLRRLVLLCIRGSRTTNVKNIVSFDTDDIEYHCFASKL